MTAEMDKSILRQLEEKFSKAFVSGFGSDYADRDPIIRPAADERFGDYQCNAAMSLAKELKAKPRDIAGKIVEDLDVGQMCEAPEIAGPGFINLRLKADWLADATGSVRGSERLGLPKVDEPLRVVVDYSGPNIAKEMHVGHLRSTIIGDVISHVLALIGHEVIRQNHIGDWGMQFGMLITYLFDAYEPSQLSSGDFDIPDIEAFYRQAQAKYKSDEAFAERSRNMVVALQGGDKDANRAWQVFRGKSIEHCEDIYRRLNVDLKREDIRGESFYNDLLPGIVKELLEEKKIAVEDDDAICIFIEGFKTKDGDPLPVIIRKRDGGYLYATTDLAAIKFRVNELKANRIIYVTDARQILHFEQIFAVAHKAGLDIQAETERQTQFDHVTFGSVLGEDGRPLKTRSGENVKLAELLDEAVDRARAVVDEKNPDLSEDRRQRIAEAVGIGAVKYADLSNSRTSDYIFSFDKMLALEGNTAPYLMYAYARIKSIERKGGIGAGELPGDAKIILAEAAEVKLAKKLLQFADTLYDVADNLRPNLITNYLFELSQTFSGFYENCPVLKADSEDVKLSRLWLCDLTARTLKLGLGLLGIETLEQM